VINYYPYGKLQGNKPHRFRIVHIVIKVIRVICEICKLKMNRISYYLALLLSIATVIIVSEFASAANLNATDEEVVTVSTAWPADRARPGDAIMLAIVADIKEGYHINADVRQVKPFEDFKPYPTKVTVVDASPQLTIELPRYPRAVPVKAQYAAGELMSFKGKTVIYLPIKLEETLEPGKVALKLELEYQACAANFCLFPKKVKIEESLAVAESGAIVSEINREIFAGEDAVPKAEHSRRIAFDLFGWTFSIDISSGLGLTLLLLTAALGGMLLNFTPCVLPLIPIKIIGLSHAAKDRQQCFMLGLAMFLGVLIFWIALGVMIALVSGFSATNQLFQYPAITLLVGLIIGTMATGMFGFFSMRLPNFIYMINPEQNTLHGSFGLGILAAILSTPCTAPFMGAAAAWAATQAAATTLATFAAIGTGMALPYLVLSASPALVNKMPKTGPASVLIKQVMGFFMLAAAAYFVGVGLVSLFSTPPTPPSKIFWWPVMFFSITAGGWLAYRTLQITSKVKLRTLFAGAGLLVIVLSIWGAVRLTDQGPIDWAYYTPPRFEAAIADRKIIVMDFTAEWCLNCKALEQGVLHNPKIVKLLARENILPMKVDITGNNPTGKAKLREVGNLTIPLLIIFSPNGKQIFKSDFYTVEQLYNAISEVINRSGSSG
jgi:thiol:disulfide interchange protein DsbD